MINLKNLINPAFAFTLSEGKFTAKGKYLYFPDGELSSIPGPNDRDRIVVQIGRYKFMIFTSAYDNKITAQSAKYDKQFKNINDLAKWLNKEKAQYIGID